MRMLMIVPLALSAVFVAGAMPAAAAPYHPWCARYFNGTGVTECVYDTQAQCLATVSGIGGSCMSAPAPYPSRPMACHAATESIETRREGRRLLSWAAHDLDQRRVAPARA